MKIFTMIGGPFDGVEVPAQPNFIEGYPLVVDCDSDGFTRKARYSVNGSRLIFRGFLTAQDEAENKMLGELEPNPRYEVDVPEKKKPGQSED